jgi:hypothetical protein
MSGTSDVTNLNHMMFWPISLQHPYGYAESYWSSATHKFVTRPLWYLKYTFPPAITEGATDAWFTQQFNDPTQGPGTTEYNGHHTSVPGLVHTRIPTSADQYDNLHTGYHGSSLILDSLDVRGQIVFAFNPDNAIANSNTHLVMNPTNVELADTTTTHKPWLIILAVQHFKRDPDERELTPADVFATPLQTSIAGATSDNDDDMAWLNTQFTSNFKYNAVNQNTIRDDNRIVAPGTAAGAAPDLGTVATRAVDFAVISMKRIHFSSTDLDTRRLRSGNLNMRIRPKRRKMWYAQVETTNTTTPTSSTSTVRCMNPIHLMFMSSHGCSQGQVTGTVAAKSFACLWERLDIKANWRDDC